MNEKENSQAALQEKLARCEPRYFWASASSAHGETGYEDTAKFAETLMVLQECALLVGERLGMPSITHAFMYDANETAGFCFDPNSDPASPLVAGALQNRRVLMKDFGAGIQNFLSRHRQRP